MTKVAVIGGNLSALTLAFHLQKADFDVTVYNNKNYIKNNLMASNFCLNSCNRFNDLCRLFNIDLSPNNKTSYFFKNDRFFLFHFKGLFSIFNLKGLSFKSKLTLFFYIRNLKKTYSDLTVFDLNKAKSFDNMNAHEYLIKETNEEIVNYIEQILSSYINHSLKELSSGFLISLFNTLIQNNLEFNNNDLVTNLEKQLSISVKSEKSIIKSVRALKTKVNITSNKKESYDLVICASSTSLNLYKNPTTMQKLYLELINYSKSLNVIFELDRNSYMDFNLKSGSDVFILEQNNLISKLNFYENIDKITKMNKYYINVQINFNSLSKLFSLKDDIIFKLIKKELIHLFDIDNDSDFKNHIVLKNEVAFPKFYTEFINASNNFINMGQGEQNVYFLGSYLNAPFIEGELELSNKILNSIINEFK